MYTSVTLSGLSVYWKFCMKVRGEIGDAAVEGGIGSGLIKQIIICNMLSNDKYLKI